jgi:hypothetical protein
MPAKLYALRRCSADCSMLVTVLAAAGAINALAVARLADFSA